MNFFLSIKGVVIVETEQGNIELNQGEGYVVPKKVKHRTVSKERAVVLLLEPKRVNTKGD